ncbi:hypothetical protein [Phytohabitans suffuscus]|uniref:hypothetical protein n=1 Tax=Phytohabitans suffuscus TaxID=624315 RepID=UPI001E384B64|nr:hypothetical protein [Phytohabitans suffuscus]
MGVDLVGRFSAVRDGRALLSGGLRNVLSLADLKLGRLLDTFDGWARAGGRDAEVGPPERFAPTRVPEAAPWQLDLRGGQLRTIVWATGFRPDYRWLDVPVLDPKGRLRHDGGVVDSPACTRWACPCCDGAGPPSSTASSGTRGRSSTTSPGTWRRLPGADRQEPDRRPGATAGRPARRAPGWRRPGPPTWRPTRTSRRWPGPPGTAPARRWSAGRRCSARG